MKKGDRVRLSAEGRNRFLVPRDAFGKLGTICGKPRNPSMVRVLWDGKKTPYNYHFTFIEKVEEPPCA